MLGTNTFTIFISFSWIDLLSYVVSFFISCNSLYFKVYFVFCKYCYSSFLLIPICMGCLFPSLHFQPVCISRSKVSLLQAAYTQILFFQPFSQSMGGLGLDLVYLAPEPTALTPSVLLHRVMLAGLTEPVST